MDRCCTAWPRSSTRRSFFRKKQRQPKSNFYFSCPCTSFKNILQVLLLEGNISSYWHNLGNGACLWWVLEEASFISLKHQRLLSYRNYLQLQARQPGHPLAAYTPVLCWVCNLLGRISKVQGFDSLCSWNKCCPVHPNFSNQLQLQGVICHPTIYIPDCKSATSTTQAPVESFNQTHKQTPLYSIPMSAWKHMPCNIGPIFHLDCDWIWLEIQ